VKMARRDGLVWMIEDRPGTRSWTNVETRSGDRRTPNRGAGCEPELSYDGKYDAELTCVDG